MLFSQFFVERVHVERHGVQLALVIRHWGICEAVEDSKGLQVVPHCLIVRMENVGAVLVKIDVLHFLGIDISSDVISLVNHKNGFSVSFRLLRECGSV